MPTKIKKRSASLDEYLTTSDVAAMFDGVEVRNVQYYIKNGAIPIERVGTKGYFYVIHKDDVPAEWPPSHDE